MALACSTGEGWHPTSVVKAVTSLQIGEIVLDLNVKCVFFKLKEIRCPRVDVHHYSGCHHSLSDIVSEEIHDIFA
jgi:hypothetical protein